MFSLNFRFVIKTLGFLLIIESILMMLAAAVSFYFEETIGDSFLVSASITLLSGVMLSISGGETREGRIGKREGFLIVGLSWAVSSVFGMLPFLLGGIINDIPGAYFETMSGFTTTGASVLDDINKIPLGILFWRSVMQWIGGLGIIVIALAVLPMIGGNAAFLYDAETTGIVRERFQPRITQIAKRLLLTYVLLTVLVFVFLWMGPMNLFDSVCHALTTASTGGFSTKQSSIAYWHSSYIEYVISIFMVIGGVNFSLLYFCLKGSPKKLFKNEEARWYLSLCLIFTLVIFIGLILSKQIIIKEDAFRTALFQVTSAITTTGFTTVNFSVWGPFFAFMIYFLMVVCACAGSTSGGVKVIRIVVLFKNAINEFKRQVHPTAVLPVRINDQVLPIDVVTKVLAFIFLYLLILFVSFLVLSFTGISFEDSITASVSCMGNVGLGSIGGVNNFGNISATAKWFLSFLMLTGRLELFTVLSLFMPAFWRK